MSDFFRTISNTFGIILIVVITAIGLLAGAAVIGSIEFTPSDYISSGEVTATDGSLYLDRTGQPTVVGEINNDYGAPITNVVITVVFYEDGEEIGTAQGSPIVSTIPDGTAIPYEIRFATDADPDDYIVEFSYNESSDPADQNIEVAEANEYNRDQDSVTITGSVENTGNTDVERPQVVVTFYDENETVIGTRTDHVFPSPLAPAETAEFRVQYSTRGDVPSLGRQYADYKVVVHNDREN